jgi:hypothetical protein
MIGRTLRSLRRRGLRRTWAVAPAAASETIARQLAVPIRRAYVHRLAAWAQAPLVPAAPLDVSVVSFVQERDVPELVASVRCFLARGGTPREFVVVSDGTITPQSASVIRSIRPDVVSVQSPAEYVGRHELHPAVRSFMRGSPWGSKLATIMAMGERAPALYVDSDLWYFPRAAELRTLCAGSLPLFLQDIAPYLDPRMLRTEAPGDVTTKPVNAGMLFMPGPLDWALSLSRLDALDGDPIGDSEQAAVHLTFLGAGAEPFPTDRFVINPRRASAQDGARPRDVAVRHYTRPQRGLFWLHVPRFELEQRRNARVGASST